MATFCRYIRVQTRHTHPPTLPATASQPRPSSVAAAELARKAAGYALARPAREVLFTALSRRERYGAKPIVDTVVQRAGDALAAGAFALLDAKLRLGPGGVAAAGAAAAGAWLAAALRLGRMHAAVAAERAQKRGERQQRRQEQQRGGGGRV